MFAGYFIDIGFNSAGKEDYSDMWILCISSLFNAGTHLDLKKGVLYPQQSFEMHLRILKINITLRSSCAVHRVIASQVYA